jgi:hypothetical protein
MSVLTYNPSTLSQNVTVVNYCTTANVLLGGQTGFFLGHTVAWLVHGWNESSRHSKKLVNDTERGEKGAQNIVNKFSFYCLNKFLQRIF